MCKFIAVMGPIADMARKNIALRRLQARDVIVSCLGWLATITALALNPS